jgi:hypothetical protein
MTITLTTALPLVRRIFTFRLQLDLKAIKPKRKV